MKVIDFHTHVVPGRYPRPPAVVRGAELARDGEDRRPAFAHDDRRAHVPRVRELLLEPERAHCTARRTGYRGAGHLAAARAAVLLAGGGCRGSADGLHERVRLRTWCSSAPTRFAGMGCVALQDPVRAVRQLEHMRKSLGLRGRARRQPREWHVAGRSEVLSGLRGGGGTRIVRVRARHQAGRCGADAGSAADAGCRRRSARDGRDDQFLHHDGHSWSISTPQARLQPRWRNDRRRRSIDSTQCGRSSSRCAWCPRRRRST